MKNSNPIRVRFAPSPTGYLHIGGARTALFNYLFARHHQGEFLLRIEDTDQARSDSRLTEIIFQSLRWLGLDWDEDPVYQSKRLGQHQSVCAELLKKGKAYPCFCPQELLQKKREVALQKTGEYRYDRTCLKFTQNEREDRIQRGDAYTLRFHVPEGVTRFEDAIRGTVSVDHREVDDFVIQRSDSTPVYQIAVVVDDHDMSITHVIRGDDHLSNTPKQILIYQAMGWKIPQFAHVPLILGQDKKRLSKRHGATSVGEYEKSGFLSETLENFLALLGWSPGDNREIMSIKEMIESFSIDRISKNPAVFDETKLTWMNSRYIHNMSNEALTQRLLPSILEAGWIGEEEVQKKLPYIQQCVGLLKERMKKLTDFIDACAYFFKDPARYDESSVKKYWMKEGVLRRLKLVQESLSSLRNWSAEELEKVIRDLAEKEDVGAGKYIHPVRVALTGVGTSPGLFEVMVVLGREVVLSRLSKAIEFLTES